jgi:hypothetical protein
MSRLHDAAELFVLYSWQPWAGFWSASSADNSSNITFCFLQAAWHAAPVLAVRAPALCLFAFSCVVLAFTWNLFAQLSTYSVPYAGLPCQLMHY